MASRIGRRKFLATLGGAVASWPLAARAQQPAIVPLPRPDIRRRRVLCAVICRGLNHTGFVEGQNVAIECRFAAMVSGQTQEERQCAKLQSQPYWLHSE